MATIKKQTETATSNTPNKNVTVGNTLFTKENYLWMLAGLVVMALGFVLMSGGKSPDPKVFNDAEVYSFRRITVAPMFIIAGLLIEIFAIMKKPKTN